jgi:hypothetical protein
VNTSSPGKLLYRGPKGEQGRIANRCGAGSVDGYTGRKLTACLSIPPQETVLPPPLKGPRCLDKSGFYDIRVPLIPSYLLLREFEAPRVDVTKESMQFQVRQPSHHINSLTCCYEEAWRSMAGAEAMALTVRCRSNRRSTCKQLSVPQWVAGVMVPR